MIIKPSTTLRNEYPLISELAKQEPVFITKNGEGDVVVMGIELYTKMEEMYRLRNRIYQAEQSRLAGNRTYSLEEIEQEFLTNEGL